MPEVEAVLDKLKQELEGTVQALRRELARLRTGRATTALLDGISVDYYGARTPLNQVATLSAPEPRLLVIQPFDRSLLSEIERAIQQSDLGLNPVNDGKLIRVPIPELTEERRKELVRHVRKVCEEYRVSARNHRRDAVERLRSMLKNKEIAEDDERKALEKVEALTKSYIERIDQALKHKEAEIMEV
ncbi:MAG: ribosome recycling factor [Candidatus Binatia bacterium]|nr:ribosome recycling factor [Candidatus Binatia bacterium]